MFLVMVNKDNLPQDVILVTTDLEKAQQHFLDTCGEHASNWDDYTPHDKDVLLDQGYEYVGGNVAIVLIDTDGPTSDTDIRLELGGQPAGDMTVEQVIHDGEIALKEGMTVAEIMGLCSNNLEAACSWDIQGQVVFKGSDGKYYTITTESSIGECTNEFITDVLSEKDHE